MAKASEVFNQLDSERREVGRRVHTAGNSTRANQREVFDPAVPTNQAIIRGDWRPPRRTRSNTRSMTP